MRNTLKICISHTRQARDLLYFQSTASFSLSLSGAWSDVSDVCAIITSPLCASAAAIKRKSRCFYTLVSLLLAFRIKKNTHIQNNLRAAFGALGGKKSECQVRMGFSRCWYINLARKGARGAKLVFVINSRFCGFSLSFSIIHTRSDTWKWGALENFTHFTSSARLLLHSRCAVCRARIHSQFGDHAGTPSIVLQAFVHIYKFLLGNFTATCFVDST
jgi:hypothetical protein